MMTVHGAKGLEFARFLTGMEDEMFPYKGLEARRRRELEEERRLAYVAITRARERLFITHAATRMLFGQTRYGRPSRFLAQLPQGDLEQIVTRAPAPRFVRNRQSWSSPPRQNGTWQHPVAVTPAPRAPAPAPGERYIDREAFDDVSADSEMGEGLRRGSRVRHARFGEGEVRSVERSTELFVVAFFPGWGGKILARYLEPG